MGLSTRPAGEGGAGSDRHPVFARAWRLIGPYAASPADRRELLTGLRGRIIEIGAGDGLNFPHYPAEVRSVLAVEPEPDLRGRAEREALRWPVEIEVRAGTAEALPAADASYDAAVASLLLCSVPDQAVALAEMRRVLRRGGELRFLEHVIARNRFGATAQRGLDESGLWPRVGAGCHLARDTVTAIEAAGFTVEACRRFSSGPLPHVLGTARR